MSKRIKDHAFLLKHLSKAKPSAAKSIIKTCDKDLMNVFCECALNVLKGNVPLNKNQKQRLSVHKTSLRALTNKKHSLKKKKALLQKGGFLSALLGPIIGILSGLFGHS